MVYPQISKQCYYCQTKNKQTKLRKALGELYGHLSSKTIFTKEKHEEDESSGDTENFYPYVSLEINLDFRNKQAY